MTGPYGLQSIQHEREEKLRSLLSDRVAHEGRLLNEALTGLTLTLDELKRLGEARVFTLSQDYGPRDLDRYYGVHPMRVARFMAHWLKGRSSKHAFDALTAALIHNAIEKHVLTEARLEAGYGAWVKDAIVQLTPDRPSLATEEGRARYYAGIAARGTEVEVLKLFDKFDNIFAICVNPDDAKRAEYLDEIEQFVRPIAVKHCPELVAYFDALLADTRRLGHYRPTF